MVATTGDTGVVIAALTVSALAIVPIPAWLHWSERGTCVGSVVLGLAMNQCSVRARRAVCLGGNILAYCEFLGSAGRGRSRLGTLSPQCSLCWMGETF